jgi:hypothetical protein
VTGTRRSPTVGFAPSAEGPEYRHGGSPTLESVGTRASAEQQRVQAYDRLINGLYRWRSFQ